MRCEICGEEGDSLIKVVHRKLGPKKICQDCYDTAIEDLLGPDGCQCCR